MPRIDFADATKQVAVLSEELVTWQQTAESDSIREQNHRAQVLSRVSETMYKLVHDVQPKSVLFLAVGDTAVEGYGFEKTPYDFIETKPKDLAPHETLIISRTKVLREGPSFDRRVLYLGRWDLMLTVSGLALALSQNGHLGITENDNKTPPRM